MIFVDLDGVLADFETPARQLLACESNKSLRDIEAEIGSKAFWEKIRAVDDFYFKLPKMPDADILWQGIMQYDPDPIILTGIPSSMPNVPAEKRLWCERYFPDAEVITCYSRNKSSYCQKGDILIDDWAKYQSLWEKEGGIFILHESAVTTLEKLSLEFRHGGS